MKNIITGVGLLVVLGLALFALQYKGEMGADGAETAIYSNPEIGLQFTYRTGPEGYVITEETPLPGDPHAAGLMRTIVLTQTADLNASPTPSEAPPTIMIRVVKNTTTQTSREWAVERLSYMSAEEIRDTVVGGVDAVRYGADGLYASEEVTVTYGQNVYHFTGSYIDAESKLKKDFQPLLDSVKFIPIEDEGAGAPVNGKLDINAVCEGALSYMSFPSAVEADAFIKDCKAGNRPEVIEKYKADNGLDGRAI